MPPAMKRLLADLQLPANRFDRRALVEVHLRLAQLRNDLLRRVSLPFHRVLPPSRAVRLSYQLVHLEGVRPTGPLGLWAIIVRMETRCSRCNAPMICNPKGNCWCAELPHGPMPTETDSCLCRDCLLKDLKLSGDEDRRRFSRNDKSKLKLPIENVETTAFCLRAFGLE